MTLPVFATLLLGGLAALDAAPVAQTLFSQPLVTAALLGAVWGEWATALEVGIVLQILAASTLPVGSRTPEDYAAGGVVGAGLALALVTQRTDLVAREAAALAGCLAGLLTAAGGVPLLKWQRRRNEGLARWAEAEVLRGQDRVLDRAHAAGVVLAFGVGVSYVAVCLGLGLWALAPFVVRHSLVLAHAWRLLQPLWMGLGLAQLLHAFVRRRLTRAAVFGATLIVAWIALVIGGR